MVCRFCFFFIIDLFFLSVLFDISILILFIFNFLTLDGWYTEAFYGCNGVYVDLSDFINNINENYWPRKENPYVQTSSLSSPALFPSSSYFSSDVSTAPFSPLPSHLFFSLLFFSFLFFAFLLLWSLLLFLLFFF